ncbi:MAG: DUF393 domain-containing protein [Pseudomonadota bacterium]
MSEDEKLKVFYDGACPLCHREISFYKKRRGSETVDWVDISKSEDEYVHPGLSRTQAMSRFHVVTSSGRLLSGGSAFAGLWRSLSAFKPLGVIFSFGPLEWLLNRLYDFFLKARPSLQKLFR